MEEEVLELKKLFVVQYRLYKEGKIGYVQMKNWINEQPEYRAGAIIIIKKELEQLSLSGKDK